MNENYRHPAMPAGRRSRASSRECILLVRRRRRASAKPARAAARFRHDPARGDRRGELLEAGLAASPPTSGARPVSTSCAVTDWKSSAGTCCIRRPRRGCIVCRAVPEGPPGAGRCGERLHETCSPTRSARSCTRASIVLGTDGFGRSDTREKLRAFLRGRSPLGHARGLERAGRPTARFRRASCGGDPRSTASIRPSRVQPGSRLGVARRGRRRPARRPRSLAVLMREMHGRHQGSAGPRHRGLQGRSGDRGDGQARRPGEAGRPLVTLESDKATLDVPARLAA